MSRSSQNLRLYPAITWSKRGSRPASPSIVPAATTLRRARSFIYGDDFNSIKLDVFADFDTRQTEFGKQISPVPTNYPGYDHMTIGPVGHTTWLRIVKHERNDGLELYSAYTSNDGAHWTRGGTWQHFLGSGAQIGIAAQNIAGITVNFDYVRVYRLRH